MRKMLRSWVFLIIIAAMLLPTMVVAATAMEFGIEDAVLHDAYLNYTIRTGDSLAIIARQHYGTSEKWATDRIYYANYTYFQRTNDALEAGVNIIIPGEGLVVVAEDSWYTVKVGETLAQIALTYYGSSRKLITDRIYYANYAFFQSTNGTLEAGASILLPAEGLIRPVKDVIYSVKRDETLADIARRYYGSSAKWAIDRIYYANYSYFQSTNGELEANRLIIIPAEGQIIRAAARNSEHIVRRGETLSSISAAYYGDARLWGMIFDANRNKIAHPNLIYPNQRLVIP